METAFNNEQQFLNNLPDFETLQYQPLAKEYLKVIYISRIITLIVLAIGMGVSFYFWIEIQEFWWVLLIGFSGLALLMLAFVRISFKAKSFAMREHDIVYKSGFISLETTLIPFNRVQHIEIHEGVLMRMYNLTTLQIFTAGGAMSDLKIAGLYKTDAEKMKAFITGKINSEPEFDANEMKLENENKPQIDDANHETI